MSDCLIERNANLGKKRNGKTRVSEEYVLRKTSKGEALRSHCLTVGFEGSESFFRYRVGFV